MAARDMTAAPPAPPASAPLPYAPPPAQIEAAEAAENATQISFTLPYAVSVSTGQSLILPILDRELPARRIDLYQPGANARRPLAAIELDNAGGVGLPPGVLTLYEQGAQGAAYLGDARLATFPVGEKRLVSYALDNKVTVDREAQHQRRIVKVTIAQGVMRVIRLLRDAETYRIKSPVSEKRLLLIEHPRTGATLVSPKMADVEATANAYRVPATLSGDGVTVMDVVTEQPVEETIALSDVADDRLGVLVGSNELDAPVRNALADLAMRRRKVAEKRAELAQLKQQRAQLVDDEKRLRDNLSVINREAALYQRALDKLGETETAIETLTNTMTRTSGEIDTAEKNLKQYIATLAL
jgi:hypothetical protein